MTKMTTDNSSVPLSEIPARLTSKFWNGLYHVSLVGLFAFSIFVAADSSIRATRKYAIPRFYSRIDRVTDSNSARNYSPLESPGALSAGYDSRLREFGEHDDIVDVPPTRVAEYDATLADRNSDELQDGVNDVALIRQ